MEKGLGIVLGIEGVSIREILWIWWRFREGRGT